MLRCCEPGDICRIRPWADAERERWFGSCASPGEGRVTAPLVSGFREHQCRPRIRPVLGDVGQGWPGRLFGTPQQGDVRREAPGLRGDADGLQLFPQRLLKLHQRLSGSPRSTRCRVRRSVPQRSSRHCPGTMRMLLSQLASCSTRCAAAREKGRVRCRLSSGTRRPRQWAWAVSASSPNRRRSAGGGTRARKSLINSSCYGSMNPPFLSHR